MSDIPEKNATSFQNRNYEFCPDSNLAKKLNEIDKLADFIRKNKSDQGDLWDIIQEKLKISWTYNSNAIEGNTLTFDETLFFIREELTVKGKPLKDFIETQNHVEAIDFLYDVIRGERFISESIIKEFNSFLLSGIKSTPAVDQFGNKKINRPARENINNLPITLSRKTGVFINMLSLNRYVPKWNFLLTG